MIIKNIKIISGDKRKKIIGGVYIEYESINNVIKGDITELIFKNKKHFFEVTDIFIIGEKLNITAKEIGYWCNLFDHQKDIDLRDIIGLNLTEIRDTEHIAQIHEESCYC
jgi:hypothetical protein